ncbi:MAG: hypothetical protein IKN44_03655 [Bacteroidaceae bacterium]|nr:hypothetical protein [Bacteroidaceae bacterium]MBR3618831.1 hypothetical protein [Bacteroidaceae bacterium]
MRRRLTKIKGSCSCATFCGLDELDNLCAPTFKYACRLELRNIVDTVVVGQNAKGQDIMFL